MMAGQGEYKTVMLKPAISALPLVLLSACEIPLPATGGPCRYETSIVSGSVTEVAEWHIIVANDAETFQVDYYDLDRSYVVGEAVTFERDVITNGTCVPVQCREITAPPDPEA